MQLFAVLALEGFSLFQHIDFAPCWPGTPVRVTMVYSAVHNIKNTGIPQAETV
jgi:hypothetical protein